MSKRSSARRNEKEFAIRRREKRLRRELTGHRNGPRVIVARLSVESENDSESSDQDFVCLNWEITREPLPSNRPLEVDELARKGLECLYAHKFADADTYFREAVDLYPDGADLWNNLAAACDELGKVRESLEIADILRSRFPGYFFGIIREASQAIDRRDIDHAKNLLFGLHTRKRFHVTEFRGLVTSHIKLAVASGEFAGANKWLELWKDVETHPMQSDLIARLRHPGILAVNPIARFMRRLLPRRRNSVK